ncbi:MAG TPA: hypothetical protein VMT52_17925 [Planctomycetota bacterium]|nr:hypothetical protein [Planctomycetota bacterium]
MIIAGIDEAGYGPTLGPLVVSVSVFRTPDGEHDAAPGALPDLWRLLEKAVCRKPDGRRVPVSDSKKLFNQKKGTCDLEEGVLPFLSLDEGTCPRDLRSFLRRVARRDLAGDAAGAAEPEAYLDEYPWYRGRNAEIPRSTFPNVVTSRARRLAEALSAARVESLGLDAWPVEVLEFNRGLADSRNKASVSFAAVGAFLTRLWRGFEGERVEVFVDRQGGREHYGPLLFRTLAPRGIRITEETDAISSYDVLRRRGGAAFRVTFATDCEERCFPVALASMLSKYLREVHMFLFNQFWREHEASLKPTAGYATDARRFLGEIAPLRLGLGIDDALLVRLR